MATVELEAVLHGTSNVQALAGRIIALSAVCRGAGGQGLGRPPRPATPPPAQDVTPPKKGS